MRNNLHDEFISALHKKVPKRVDLIDQISDILKIERESAYRRLSGKVNFSVHEMGRLAKIMNISIDAMLHENPETVRLPFSLKEPMQNKTMDILYNLLESKVKCLENNIEKNYAENGNVYNCVPFEFYMYYPLLMKFMLFKWGHHFVGTKEFDNFSDWEVPQKVFDFRKRIETASEFNKMFFIWDTTTIWTLLKEIEYFQKVQAITPEESYNIKQQLIILMTNLEELLQGTLIPEKPIFRNMDFYVSTVNIGFTCCFYLSPLMHSIIFQTNYSYTFIEDDIESFKQMKRWVESLRNVSMLISESGRSERKLFFETQYKMINEQLK